MNASHTATASPVNLHPAGTRRVQRTVLVAMYAALAAQLAIWSTLAARAGLTAAFTQAHHGAEAGVVAGGAVWLVQLTLAVALATIRYSFHDRGGLFAYMTQNPPRSWIAWGRYFVASHPAGLLMLIMTSALPVGKTDREHLIGGRVLPGSRQRPLLHGQARTGHLRYPQPVQRKQGDEGVLSRRAEPGGDQQRAEFAAVQPGGV